LGFGLGALLAGLGGLLGGGIIPLAAATPALAGATTFGATDLENCAAAQALTLSTDGGQAKPLPPNASEVAQAVHKEAPAEPGAVLAEVK